jgi:hypothetical protein
MSNAEACGAREAVGRPPGLPLRPLRNQPRFGVAPERDLSFTTLIPQDAAQGLSSPTSVRSPHRHRPDQCRAHGSAADPARLESIMGAARGLAKANNLKMRLIKFTNRIDIEDIVP